jgi:conjugal transfer/entry exclusion protein
VSVSARAQASSVREADQLANHRARAKKQRFFHTGFADKQQVRRV